MTTIECPPATRRWNEPKEKRDIVEMQASGWFIEDEKIAAFAVLEISGAQVPDEFQALGFAAGKGCLAAGRVGDNQVQLLRGPPAAG